MATVLFVDDEPGIRRAVQYWLEHRGHAVVTAASVAEGIERLAQQRFDGAFLDIWLPDGKGFALYAHIQEHYAALARNIVFVSGDILPDASIRSQLQALGHPVLSKPFDLDELDHFTRAWVRSSGGFALPMDNEPPSRPL